MVVGRSSATDSRFALARYNGNGKLDKTFGNNGKVVTQFGNSTNYALTANIQPDEKIIAAGYTTSPAGQDFAIARYRTDGIVEKTSENTININNAITIYPNPATQYLLIQGLHATKQTHITVIDLQGNVRLRATASFNNYKLNISSLKAGNYVLNCEVNGSTESKNFIKE